MYESFIRAGADLTSPSGAAYKAKTALDAVNRVCNSSAVPAAAPLAAAPPPLLTAPPPAAASIGAASTGGARAGGGRVPDAARAQQGGVPRSTAGRGPLATVALVVAPGAIGLVVLALCLRRKRAADRPSEAARLTKDMEKASDKGSESERGAHELGGAYTSDVDDKLGCYESGEEAAPHVEATPKTSALLDKL